MSHEITKTDNVVLHKNAAWHGLGLVVEDAPTPREALILAGLDWGVESKPLYIMTGVNDDGEPEYEVLDSHVANYRADTGEKLGVVSSGYQVLSNAEMADFCESLSEDRQVYVETAGSIQAGRKVWFLLKGQEFEVANGDGMFPYIMVSNGHDGNTTFRVTPTTVRVVCSNTMHMVIPHFDTGALQGSAITIKHFSSIMERVEEARKALREFNRSREETIKLANHLAAKPVTSDAVKEFFLESYTADFGEIPENPQNGWEERRSNKAKSAYNSFSRRFDDERKIAGNSWWNAFNAFSGLVQHDVKARGKDDADRVEKRVNSNLFGLAQDRTQAALRLAFQKSVA